MVFPLKGSVGLETLPLSKLKLVKVFGRFVAPNVSVLTLEPFAHKLKSFSLYLNAILLKSRALGKLKLIHSSSEYIDKHLHGGVADMIMTCPPYFNIEKYESADGQLTDIKKYEDFLFIYKFILRKCCNKLKPGGFFAVVLANFRIDGKLYDFCGDTKDILKQELDFHDEVILEMSPAKRHPLYTQAITNLNCLKTHEYCLVFRKENNKEDLIKRNNDINWNRPLVKDVYRNKDRLFWAEDKKDWLDEKLGISTNSLDRFF